MKRGCLQTVFFSVFLLAVFGASTYFWFTFFVKGRSLPTPNLIGKSVAEATRLTSDLGIGLEIDHGHRRNSDRVPVGHVVWQNRTPGAASFIKRGSSIRVELSSGPLVLRIPDLAGQTSGTSLLRLGQLNLQVGNLSYVAAEPAGVLAADPARGTIVAPQTKVSLLVAVPPAPPTYVMPDLIDRRLELVRPDLERQKLKVTTVKFEAYPGIADGVIIRQYPLRGAPVSSRDAISLVVSRSEDTSIIEADQ